MNKVIIYGDLISQPTRAVYWFCLLNNIPHEFKLLSIGKGENRTSEEYAKVNPLLKLPGIKHGDVCLGESHTILRYLAEEFKLVNFYNYESLVAKCQVDTYLDWHHLGLRRWASGYFFQQFIVPNRMQQEPNKEILEFHRNGLVPAFKEIERVFLKNGENNFISSKDNPTIADFSCYSEIKQLDILGYKGISENFPHIKNWMRRMESLSSYDQVHKILHSLKNKVSPNSKL
ncbi:hypothetical protein CYY_009810 [Polysphondylium violaceum]|uniref:Glutathione S-transferase n=1 Tax=Polysphondylium violaceum TaxID=133409 RepID=A0A8J4V077_9MYCE|nr:hypothetical protein CYY_009810 [Polysphondylium violaceum]